MKKHIKHFSILTFTLFTLPVLASGAIETTRTIMSSGHQGFPYRPNVATFSVANGYCVAAEQQGDSYGDDIYTRCMRSFLPYREDTDNNRNGCEAKTIEYSGYCAIEVPFLRHNEGGTFENIRNKQFTLGNATVQCDNGNLKITNSQCIEVPHPCYAYNHKDIEWPVSYPSWAMAGGSHQKPNCKGDLQENLIPFQKSILKPDSTDYHQADSFKDVMCFDNELKVLPSFNQSCNYIPKHCAAETRSEGNCNFQLPFTPHIYNTANQDAPGTTINRSFDGSTYHGDITATCFDGTFNTNTFTCFQNPICDNSSEYACSVGSPVNQSSTNNQWFTCEEGFTLQGNTCVKTRTVSGYTCQPEIVITNGGSDFRFFDAVYNSGSCTYSKKQSLLPNTAICEGSPPENKEYCKCGRWMDFPEFNSTYEC